MCVYIYIYIYISLKLHRVLFLFKNKHDCDIDFIQKFNKQKVNIKRLTTILPVFAPFRQQ